MTLPGTWLLARARRLLDPGLVESVVVPTISDLQHEVRLAGASRVGRGFALARGCAAVVRLLFVDGLIWRFPMGRLLTVLLLGSVGSVLFLGAARIARGPGLAAALLLVAVLATIMLRLLEPTESYGRALMNCLGIGLMMGTTSWIWALVGSGHAGRLPWYAYVLSFGFMTGCVCFGSTLAAAFVWRPSADPLIRRRLLQVVEAAGVFVAAYLVVYFGPLTSRNAPPDLHTFSWALFLGFFFAAVSTAVYLPVLLGIRRRVSLLPARVLLAVVGAALFPIPLLGFPFLQGRFSSTWQSLAAHPVTLAMGAVPYVVAGAVLGWLLAGRRQATT